METSNNCCGFNKMIDCMAHTGCACCGWNPEVAKRRTGELKRKLRLPAAEKGKSVIQKAHA